MLGPDAAMMIGAPLSAPIVEETTKGIGMVLLFWLARGEFDNVRDGFIYGALVGAGFNWFESALYVQQNFVEFGNAPYGFQLGTRYAWLGMAGHAMFSGIFGASLGVARATRTWLPCWRRWPVCAGGAGPCVEELAAAVLYAGRGQDRRSRADRSLAPPTWGWDAMWTASITNLIIFLPYALLLVPSSAAAARQNERDPRGAGPEVGRASRPRNTRLCGRPHVPHATHRPAPHTSPPR